MPLVVVVDGDGGRAGRAFRVAGLRFRLRVRLLITLLALAAAGAAPRRPARSPAAAALVGALQLAHVDGDGGVRPGGVFPAVRVDLAAEVRVPVVLDLVVCSAGKVAGDQGPPASIGFGANTISRRKEIDRGTMVTYAFHWQPRSVPSCFNLRTTSSNTLGTTPLLAVFPGQQRHNFPATISHHASLTVQHEFGATN